MEENKRDYGFKRRGAMVEVRDGFSLLNRGWYEAKIDKPTALKGYGFYVVGKDSSSRGVDQVKCCPTSTIRPLPPPPAAHRSFEPLDVVDAFVCNGWWKGVVSKVDILKGVKLYSVVLLETPVEFTKLIVTSNSRDLRFHWVWTKSGKWVQPPKAKDIPSIGDCTDSTDELTKKRDREPEAQVATGKIEFLREGSWVEVLYEGALYEAKIIEKCQKDLLFILCKARSGGCLQRYFLSSLYRPCPPPPAADQSYEPLDVIDALLCNRWWKGIVTGIEILNSKTGSTNLYNVVLFENPPEFRKQSFTTEELRFHRVWADDGQWVRSPKSKEIPHVSYSKEQSGYIASNPGEDCTFISKNNMCPENEEILPKNAKKFRKESSAVPFSAEEPSVVSISKNLIEKVTESVQAKSLMLDSGANLPLNSGKNKSHKEQETRSENSMSKFMENREREPNALVASQQVASAGEKETNSENFNPSSAVDLQSRSDRVNEKKMSFKRSSRHWKYVDSLLVLILLPQNPHFGPLSECNEAVRESIALGYMMAFANLVEKVSELEIESLTDCYLKALSEFENVGFDVKPVVDCINELLSLKTRQEELANLSKEVDKKIVECQDEKAKLEEDVLAVKEKFRAKAAAFGRNLK